MRKGPHPLPVHLGMAAANMKGIQGYALNFPASLTQNDAVEMVRGIKMYQEHSFLPNPLPLETIWQDGGVSVKAPIMAQKKMTDADSFPLLIIPSLINKTNILDVSENKSMLRWFKTHGIDAYMLDWGDFTCDQEKNIDMDALIQEKLVKAIQSVSQKTGRSVDVAGYCMGGVLLLAAHNHAQDHVRRMVLLASPWDFHIGTSSLAQNVRIWSPTVLPVVKQRKHLPAEWVQALFASLDPNGSAQKFIKFASMDQDSSEAKLFVSVEDWLNDGINLPENIAHHCIQDWFIDNKPALGQWSIAGTNIDVENIQTDVLVIAARNDKLVPLDCALSVEKSLNKARVNVMTPNCGHIGLIVGQQAEKSVWKPMLYWLKQK